MLISRFSFSTATEVKFGRGFALNVATEIEKYGKNVLLVIGQSTTRAHFLSEQFRDANIKTRVFNAPHEPSLDLVENGVELAKTHRCDCVVAIGGGSVIDTGKAISALVPSKRSIMEHLEVVGLSIPLEDVPLPFIAIPTTAGTGAEVTRNAVIDIPSARRKVSLRDVSMLPDLAIIDPALTDNTPKYITLCTGLDAITQVIEPYISSRANPLTDALCRSAIPCGLSALSSLMQGESPDARVDIAWTSLCGGMALANSGLGVVHGLAGPLGGLSGAPHGAICGALLPYGLRMNEAHVDCPQTKMRLLEIREWIANALGCDAAVAFDELATWIKSNGLVGLDQLKINKSHRNEAVKMAVTSSSMQANPTFLTEDELCELMEQAR